MVVILTLKAGGTQVFVVDEADSRWHEPRLADDPPLLAAGTGEGGAGLCRLPAGRWVVGAFGCGKYGDGCRHAAMAAGSRGRAADIDGVFAGRRGTAADKRRHCRHIRHKNWRWGEQGMGG